MGPMPNADDVLMILGMNSADAPSRLRLIAETRDTATTPGPTPVRRFRLARVERADRIAPALEDARTAPRS
jgi:hypothetical protein